MIESNLTPAGGSRRVASRSSRGQRISQLPCGHRAPKARSGKQSEVEAQKEVSETLTITTRKGTRKENTRNRRRDRRNIKSATSKQEWRGLARHAAAQLNRSAQPRALQGTAENKIYPNTHNISKTTYIRKLTEDASIPNKLK